ncbi:NACHT, LRR and PYD domains-containing protein 12-like, partial [Gouania willdenowi]|uniref:NACHT, LRR and PYD domains-containing protein 12-like n=1 Tax=Gouania willdenowi TaxID=441366 RepID=UPI0010557CE8
CNQKQNITNTLKSKLKKKFQCVSEGVAKAGSPILLKEIFTELYITEGGSGEVNQEHEVIQIETASRRSDTAERAITLEELFKAPPGRPRPIRTVMTKGVAGIGKTLLTHKFTVDWAEDKAQQEVHYTFPLTFRELNVLRGRSFSLVGLLDHFFSGSKEAGICSFQDFLVLFILDGLDECRLTLDFLSTQTLTDVSESTSVEVLLINLIRGELLPSARLWITTRPAAANQIPPEFVDMVTEVRGFTDPQKEEYFRKRSTDEEQVSRIMSHIRTCRSLHIMCHIPLFCWITATVLEDMLKSREEGELPRTLTQIYSHYVVLQTKVKMVKFDGRAATNPHWSPQNREMMESLGKLAFEQLQKGKLIFYESDLTECGMDLRAASVCSGVFTQVFREESSLYQDKVFTFIHLSLQEFLAAFHVHQTFISSNVNLLEHQPLKKNSWMFLLYKKTLNRLHSGGQPDLNLLHQSAVNEALRSPNGHLDLFLRFLLGLSLPTNQRLLQGLLAQTGSDSQTNQRTVEYIKEKLSESLSTERSINLFHCLNEVNDHSLLEEIQQSMRSGRLSTEELSPAQWSALVFILLSSQEHLEVFDLKSFSPSEEAFLKLLPVINASKKVKLSSCGLSERSCAALSSVLSSQSSSVKHLDLSNNDLQDSGVKLLCEGLKSPHCKLDSLSLSGCVITEVGGASLAAALSSNSSSVRELDLSYNHPGDSAVKLLSQRLNTLRLSSCGLSERSCAALPSVLSSQSSSVKHLDLSNNDLQDSGVKLLCEGLKSPHCKLDYLSLSGCVITEVGGASLAAALSSNSSSVRELDLSYNHPGDSAVKLLENKGATPRRTHWYARAWPGPPTPEDHYQDQSSPPVPKSTPPGPGAPKGETSGKSPPGSTPPLNPVHEPATVKQDRTAPDGARTAAQAPPPTGQRKPQGNATHRRPPPQKGGTHPKQSPTTGAPDPPTLGPQVHAEQHGRRPPPRRNRERPSRREARARIRASTGPPGTTIQCPLQGGSPGHPATHQPTSGRTQAPPARSHQLTPSGTSRAPPPHGGHPRPHACRHETPPRRQHSPEDGGPQATRPTPPKAARRHTKRQPVPGRTAGERAPRRLNQRPPPRHSAHGVRRTQPADQPPPTQIRQCKNHRADHVGEQWINANTNSINRKLRLSDNNRMVTCLKEEELHHDHQDRFDYYQVLCSTGLTGRCYWEVEWNGYVSIAVSYRGIRRKGRSYDCWFGSNNQSWILEYDSGFYSFRHNNIITRSSCSCGSSGRVGVYVDRTAGCLSFYEVSSDSLTLIHTVCTSFTDTLYPGFGFWSYGSSVSLSPL